MKNRWHDWKNERSPPADWDRTTAHELLPARYEAAGGDETSLQVRADVIGLAKAELGIEVERSIRVMQGCLAAVQSIAALTGLCHAGSDRRLPEPDRAAQPDALPAAARRRLGPHVAAGTDGGNQLCGRRLEPPNNRLVERVIPVVLNPLLCPTAIAAGMISRAPRTVFVAAHCSEGFGKRCCADRAGLQREIMAKTVTEM